MSANNEWTLMFYFAGDNRLAQSMVTQLKAIKNAGWHENATVMVYFDPGEKGAPTRLFDVNHYQKREQSFQIGDGEDWFVPNLIEDRVTPKMLGVVEAKAEKKLKTASRALGLTATVKALKELHAELIISDTLSAKKSLEDFLDFCVLNRPAKHYMLFLVGHGGVVGNDAFLPDENPVTAIKLKQLGHILRGFTRKAKDTGGTFELLGLHSCSMSAVEVAYELKGTANYMMATEGFSFVYSWPYRQILKKLFHTVEQAKESNVEVNVKWLIKSLYELSLHNSIDFMFAGFSADISLCNLDKAKVTELTEPLEELAKALKRGLRHKRDMERILLAHLKSQSYWQEIYTDLYDFCSCLYKLYDKDGEKDSPIRLACSKVMKRLAAAPKPDNFDSLVIYSDHFGPTYQYSHGLSIFFPWTRPIPDGLEDIMKIYKGYAFTEALKEHPWISFLEDYFEKTRRKLREEEDGKFKDGYQEQIEDYTSVIKFGRRSNGSIARAVADQQKDIVEIDDGAVSDGSTSANGATLDGPAPIKDNPADAGGSDCNCASIKNFDRRFSISSRVAESFNSRHRRKS